MTLNPQTPIALHLNHRKQIFGLSYGMIAGLAFSVTLWGLDGLKLAQAFAYFPWTKFVVGAPLAMLVCGAAGWLTSRWGKPLLGVLLWALAAGALAWLTILVPIVIAPSAMKLLVPEFRSLLHYTFYDNTTILTAVAFGWVGITAFIVAIIQVPMVEQAIFSINLLGKIMPHIICAVLMLVGGSVADSLNNRPLREPLLSMNATIQFALDHQGKQVSPKAARDVHLASLRTVQDLITEERRLVVSDFDPLLENVTILVNFDGNWAECDTIFGHALTCHSITP